MSLSTILLIVAVIVFIIDSFKVGAPVNLTAVGLAFFAGSFLVGSF